MERIERKLDAVAPWRNRRQRLGLECRECEVVCERVVSPWQCLRSGCPYTYSYEDGDTTYFGCLHKIFLPELDLGAFLEDGGRLRKGPDPYGPLRVSRTPLPCCRVWIEQAYEAAAAAANCCNPTFFHHPSGAAEDTIRMTTGCCKGDDHPKGDSRTEGDRGPEAATGPQN